METQVKADSTGNEEHLLLQEIATVFLKQPSTPAGTNDAVPSYPQSGAPSDATAEEFLTEALNARNPLSIAKVGALAAATVSDALSPDGSTKIEAAIQLAGRVRRLPRLRHAAAGLTKLFQDADAVAAVAHVSGETFTAAILEKMASYRVNETEARRRTVLAARRLRSRLAGQPSESQPPSPEPAEEDN